MNFLGHAYIARNHPELIPGNFAGDSYKGQLTKFSHLPAHILKGVHLHRFIDNYTDNHDAIKEVADLFKKKGVTRVSYIAADILLDHHLSSNWKLYTSVPYPDFVDLVYHETDKNLIHLSSEFNWIYERLKDYGWFFDYPSEAGIGKILNQFSARLGFDNDLDRCLHIYLENKAQADQYFKTFLNDIVDKSDQYILDLKA